MPGLNFRILGPTAATRDGEALPLGSPKQRALLATLLLEPGRVVPLHRLLALLWEDPPSSATANLRTYAAGLRKVLGPVLVARDGGYVLDAGPEAADLGRFQAELAAARAARAAGDPERAEERFGRALGLWRGGCGEDLPDDLPLRHRLAAVTELRVIALEELADLQLGRGAGPALVPRLREALVEHPTREGLWIRLMTALAAAGDTTGALEAYQRARAELAGRLGVDPGPELRALHQAILKRDVPATAPPRPGTVPHELPPRPRVLLGRAEPAALLAAAARDRGPDRPVLLGIDGPGGIGKSTLAVELAHRLSAEHPDGEVYLDLQGGQAGLRPATPAELLARLVRSWGGPEPDRQDADALAARWRSLTHDRRVLVVLDNALDAAQVQPLLPNGPGCTVLVTSRRRLTTLDLTRRLTLSTLDTERAAEVLRAHAADPADPGLARVAALCGGLPLALRMAAARLAARADWTADDLADRLADDRRRLDELGFPDVGVRATFASSWAALDGSADPVDRAAARLFCLLGLLPVSACAVPAACALLDVADGDALLGRLVDLQLVELSGGRIRLHDLLRLYARDVAARAVPDPEAALERAAWYYAESARRARHRIRDLAARPLPPSPLTQAVPTSPGTRAEAVRWLTAEAPSLRELVLARPAGPIEVTAELVRSLALYDGLAGSFRDAIAVAGVLVELAAGRGDADNELFGRRLIAINHQRLRRYPEAKAAIAPAVALLEAAADPIERLTTLNALGIFQTEWGEYDDGERTLLAALETARRAGEGAWVAILLTGLGMHYRERGRVERSVPLLREALGIRRELADPVGETYTLMQLGKALAAVGSLPDGLEQLDAALATAAHLGSAELAREIRMDRMEVLAVAGRMRDARAELRAALEVCRTLADEALTAEVLREAERLAVPGP